MDDYRHILLAVDLTDESEALAERARRLQERFGARLSLVHVVEYVPMAYSGDLALPEDFNLEQELVDAARQRMDRMGERLGVAAQDRHIALGSAWREVLRVAQEQDADLILVGSHGRRGLATLLGSTARSVLQHAVCDVLAMRVGDAT